MILCVTLNPCLDKTLLVPEWTPGDSVRGVSVREIVGGKGNNVARALKRLGHPDVQPVLLLGGSVGRRCEEHLRNDDAMEPIIVATESPTREILTVRTDGTDDQSAFFDPDPTIQIQEADALIGVVGQALSCGGVRALVMSGSSPSLATHGVYSELIALANERRVPTYLDTYGPSLESIWGFWPEVIQMNFREASLHLKLGNKRPGDAEIIGLLERLSRHGVRVAVVTDGPNRFLARIEGTTYRVAPPAIEPINPIGSGDCFLAGLVDGRMSGLNPVDLLRRATACAVVNALAWDAGDITSDKVASLAGEVAVDLLGRD